MIVKVVSAIGGGVIDCEVKPNSTIAEDFSRDISEVIISARNGELGQTAPIVPGDFIKFLRNFIPDIASPILK